jgi:hypothetical protein
VQSAINLVITAVFAGVLNDLGFWLERGRVRYHRGGYDDAEKLCDAQQAGCQREAVQAQAGDDGLDHGKCVQFHLVRSSDVASQHSRLQYNCAKYLTGRALGCVSRVFHNALLHRVPNVSPQFQHLALYDGWLGDVWFMLSVHGLYRYSGPGTTPS